MNVAEWILCIGTWIVILFFMKFGSIMDSITLLFVSLFYMHYRRDE